MTDLDRLLDEYPTLSPSERVDADLRLAAHPERADAWARARRLADLFDAAAPDASDDLARRAVDRRMGRGRLGGLPYTPEADHIEARLDLIEAEAEDPVARFERMTGRRLAETPTDRGPIGGDSAPERPQLMMVPRRRSRLPRFAAAAAVLIVGYGALWIASSASVTPRDQLADLGSIEAQAPPTFRSAQAAPDADALTEALQAVRDSRRTTLGLFPHYDPARLDAAADQLATVADGAEPSTWVSQEARLALGRVHLARQRDVEAARVLGELVREGGYRAPVARRLLDAIRAGLPTDAGG